MEEATKYRPVDALLSNLQETTLSLGAASWTSGEFQGRARPGNNSEEIVFERGKMFQGMLNIE